MYIPPNSTQEKLNEFIDSLAESVALAKTFDPAIIVILGDFYAGNNYLDSKYQNHSGITFFDRQLNDITSSLDLIQLIDQPTRQNANTANLRDLVFVSDADSVKENGVDSPFSQIDHYPVHVTINITKPSYNRRSKTIRDYNLLDADKLTRELMQTDWDSILNQPMNQATELFTQTILNAADNAIPTRTIQFSPNDKAWCTSELRREIRKRDRLFRTALRLQTEESWTRWRRQRNLTTELNKNLKGKYRATQVKQLLATRNEPYKYHNILRQMTGRTKPQTLPTLIKPDGQTTTDDYDKANLLNEQFADQSRLDAENRIIPGATIPNPEVPILDSITITESEVLKLLNSLNVNKSCGPDNLPPEILKLIAILIVSPLTKLFNKSLRFGIFPSLWKQATIHPIFKKKGSASDPLNYRPISLLPCISKIFEKIIFNRVYKHISENQLFTEKQSGYRPNHSTHIQLLYLVHNIYESIDGGKDFTAIFLDISKYFDKIWHVGLLHKCKILYGISGQLHNWLKSYLTNRSIRVTVGNSLSKPLIINAGCPQGSVLGPVLALIYLNDLADETHNESLFYADDTSLHASYSRQPILHPSTQQHNSSTSDFHMACISLQNDLNTISEFGTKWLIRFNAAKTTLMTFSHTVPPSSPSLYFDNCLIPSTRCHTHLGLTLSTDLRFHDHVNNIIKKVNIALSPLYAIARFLPRTILLQIYNTYIRPIFDYSDIVYDGLITTKDRLRLERLQMRAARLLTGALFHTSHDKLRSELGWDSLDIRRTKHRLVFYHKLLVPQADIPQYIQDIIPKTRHHNTGLALRNANARTLPRNRTTLFQQSFVPQTTKQWNNLPESIRTDPCLKTFKRAIDSRFGAEVAPKFNSYGSKKGNILHTRLRLNSSELNANLFKIQKSSSSSCECGNPSETVAHFVLNCPRFSVLRSELFDEVSRLLPNFSDINNVSKLNVLLDGKDVSEKGLKIAKTFQNFLIKTKRFQV